MNKKISVIMSVYNDEQNIENAILGIINQTYKNFEFLIIDDCSSDSTKEILEKFKNLDNRIQIYNNKKNIGLTKSLNILLKASQGEFIARQDSDDVSLVDRFEKQLIELKKENVVGCATRAIVKNSSRVTPNKSYFLPKKFVMNIKNPFVHGSLLLKREEVMRVGGYDENFYYAQDYKLMSDLLNLNKKITILKEPLYVLNLKNNISTKFKEEQNYYAYCVRKNTKPIRKAAI